MIWRGVLALSCSTCCGITIACGELGWWSVWIAARRAEQGKRVAAEVATAGGQGHFVRCDIGEPIAVERAINLVIESDGRIDGIVHNATSDLSPVPADLHQVLRGY